MVNWFHFTPKLQLVDSYFLQIKLRILRTLWIQREKVQPFKLTVYMGGEQGRLSMHAIFFFFFWSLSRIYPL